MNTVNDWKKLKKIKQNITARKMRVLDSWIGKQYSLFLETIHQEPEMVADKFWETQLQILSTKQTQNVVIHDVNNTEVDFEVGEANYQTNQKIFLQLIWSLQRKQKIENRIKKFLQKKLELANNEKENVRHWKRSRFIKSKFGCPEKFQLQYKSPFKSQRIESTQNDRRIEMLETSSMLNIGF